MIASRCFLGLAFLACLGWAYDKPAWDSICAALGALAALIATFAIPRENRRASQIQELGDGAIGIQAGRDANIRDISSKRAP